MRKRLVWIAALLLSTAAVAHVQDDEADRLERVRREANTRSAVATYAFYLTDVHGPRLTGSPAFVRAATWATQTLRDAGVKPLLFGLLAGLGGALVAAQVLRMSLFGLSPFDPLSYVGVTLILTITALTAVAVPAWRATRVDPLTALHCE